MDRKILIEVSDEEYEKIKNGYLAEVSNPIANVPTKKILDELQRRFLIENMGRCRDPSSQRYFCEYKSKGIDKNIEFVLFVKEFDE